MTVCALLPPDENEDDDAVIIHALALLASRLRQAPGAPCFTSSDNTKAYIKLQLATLEREVFMVLYLDNQHRLLECETLFMGTINHTEVHPREVVKAVLRYNAAAVILAHNHPSGESEPSQADRHITQQMVKALALVDVRVLDHLIVGCGEPLSFAERGWL